jgi:hypothetical protein
MVGISEDVVTIVLNLLPGFVTAWVYYGLTAHPKQSPFERTVQALIFTAIVRALVIPVRWFLVGIALNTGIIVGSWTADVEYVYSFLIAFLLGHLLVYAANKDLYHSFIRRFDPSAPTSYPSEWFSTFAQHSRYIILHLAGERRLQGWPYEWPDRPDSGHFVIQEPKWLLDDNTAVPIIVDEIMLIPACDVRMVEFLKYSDQTEGHADAIREAEERLVNLRSDSPDDISDSGTDEKETEADVLDEDGEDDDNPEQLSN